MAAQVRHGDFRSGEITPDEHKRMVHAVGTLDKLHINQRPITTATSIHAEVRRMQALHDIGLVLIDYLQLMNAPAHQQRYVEVGSITRELKLAARALDLPFLVACRNEIVSADAAIGIRVFPLDRLGVG